MSVYAYILAGSQALMLFALALIWRELRKLPRGRVRLDDPISRRWARYDEPTCLRKTSRRVGGNKVPGETRRASR